MLVAFTHIVSPRIGECELTHLQREPIDYILAVEQHAAYCRMLRECGARVLELDVNRSFPDSTFIEDTAVVLDEIAVMANIGIASRQGEVEGIESELARYRKTARIHPPATLDGGDVLLVERRLFVGLSARTNMAGVESLQAILIPFGYEVIPVKLNECLHLKSACTAVSDDTLLINPRWLDLTFFSGFRLIEVPGSEPWGANVLRIGETLCLHSGFVRTIELLEKGGYSLRTVDISELLKAEAGMTCSSLLFTSPV